MNIEITDAEIEAFIRSDIQRRIDRIFNVFQKENVHNSMGFDPRLDRIVREVVWREVQNVLEKQPDLLQGMIRDAVKELGPRAIADMVAEKVRDSMYRAAESYAPLDP